MVIIGQRIQRAPSVLIIASKGKTKHMYNTQYINIFGQVLSKQKYFAKVRYFNYGHVISLSIEYPDLVSV